MIEQKDQLVRLFFPLLLTKKGKPRKRQDPVYVSMNGKCLVIMRGRVVEAPAWVPEVCAQMYGSGSKYEDAFECFVSKRKTQTK